MKELIKKSIDGSYKTFADVRSGCACGACGCMSACTTTSAERIYAYSKSQIESNYRTTYDAIK